MMSYIAICPCTILAVLFPCLHVEYGQVRVSHYGTVLVQRTSGSAFIPVVQALRWLGPQLASSPEVVALLSAHLTDDVKKDLQRDIHLLPSWAISIVTDVLSADRVAA